MSRRRAPLRCFCGACATHGVLERPSEHNPFPLVEPRCETHGTPRPKASWLEAARVIAATQELAHA